MTITTRDCVACVACASVCLRGSITIRKMKTGFICQLLQRSLCGMREVPTGLPDKLHADVTLGDFWRVKEAPNIPDTNEGISLVGVHTPKGRQALEQIIAQGSCFAEVLPKECCAYAYRRVSRKPGRKIGRKSWKVC